MTVPKNMLAMLQIRSGGNQTIKIEFMEGYIATSQPKSSTAINLRFCTMGPTRYKNMQCSGGQSQRTDRNIKDWE